MSTNPTFNTVTAKTIIVNDPGQISAVGTIIGRDITATGNIWAANGSSGMATFSRVSASGTVTGGNFVTGSTIDAAAQIRTPYVRANSTIAVGNGGFGIDGSTTTITNSGINTPSLTATGNIVIGNVTTVGRVSATGNVSGNYILGNGYFLTGLAGGVGTYGNTNVAQYLPTYTGALTGGNLTVGSSTLINNNLSLQNIVAAANITAGRINSATMSLSGNVLSPLTVSGTVTGTNLNTTGQMSATGNVQGGNVLAIGTVSAIGNIAGNYIFGNGAFLTGIANGGGGGSAYGNANVAAYLPTYTGALSGANLAIGGSTLTANSLSVPLDVVAGRNINGANLVGTIRTASQTGITQVGTLGTLSVAGQIQASSMALSGAILAGGPITGTTLSGTGLSISGSATINGNLTLPAGGRVSTTGNITGSYILGNGSQLTGLGGPVLMATATVGQNLPTSPSSPSQFSLIYNSVSSNIQGGYNNSTGFFTAPTAGFYQVSACCAVAPLSWGQVLNYYGEGVLGIYKNGTPVAAGPYIGFRGVVIGGVPLQAIVPSSVSALIYLAVNDTVQCKLAYITNAPTNFWRTYDNSFQIPNYFQAIWIRS